MYDCIIIGAGVAGSVVARKLAEEQNKKVLVIEKRDHVGGNCYDEVDSHGILVQPYGPHIFHTGLEEVREFLSRFTEWYDFGHKVVAKVGDQLIPVPFNLNTLHMVYDEEKATRLEKLLIESYGEGSRVPILKLRENPDRDVQEIADYVYENVFLHYTMKQWGKTPEEISPEVTGRVPVVVSRDDRYFGDKYQGVPIEGFTPMFEEMLDHENITICLNAECEEILSFTEDGKIVILDNDFNEELELQAGEYTGDVIFTGAIDELFDCCYGRLPYRSLDFRFEHLDQEDFQEGHSVVNYTVSEEFTRITEFKYLTGQKDAVGTTIVREYPMAYTAEEGQLPYYAIDNPENQALYAKYRGLAEKYPKFHLLGRLAEYKYYNIDLMTKKALELADDLK